MNRTSRRGVRALVAAATIALLPALVPAVADAAQLRYRDAVGDVQKLDLADDAADDELTPDPTATSGDIKDVFVHYRKGRLVIRANYVDHKPRRDTSLSFVGEIKTNEKRRWIYEVETDFGTYAGKDALRSYRTYRPTCEIGLRFNFRQNFTRVVVPLSCLSNPRWVKVSVGAVTVQLDEKALKEFLENDAVTELPKGAFVVRADDSGSPAVMDQLSWTPRVYR
jgi:hypothetical protein